MSYKKKKEELEAPDAFQRTGGKFRDWLQKQQKVFFGIVVAALAVFLVAAIVKSVGGKKEGQAAQALAKALEVVKRPVADKPDANATGDDAPFPTQQAKDQAVVQSLEAFRKQYPDTEAADTASLSIAQAELRLGQTDAALADFDKYLSRRPSTDPLRAVALEGKGYAFEAKGQLDQALSAFAQLSDSKSTLLSGMGLYHQARIFILQNKKDEAAKILAQIPIDYPSSAAAQLAKDRLAMLAAQGVKVPQTAAPATSPVTATVGQGS